MTVTLKIDHVTTYRYRRAVEFSAHRVAFHPRTAHDIRVLESTLEVSPQSRQHWVHDVFSNSVVIVQPLIQSAELRIAASVTVEHYGVQNETLPVEASAKIYPFEYSAEDRIDLAGFLPLQYSKQAEQVQDWVKRFLPGRGRIHSRDILINITEAIRSDFTYAARTSMGTQSPAETLRLRSGTCRDFALLMMEAVRGLGFAARFVSGYIYDKALDNIDSDGEPRSDGTTSEFQSHDVGGTIGSGATHAWLHVFLPGAGWVPFDPTNTLYGGTDLIRVAVSRTPEQAAPVSGSWIGQSADFIGMDVNVSVRRI